MHKHATGINNTKIFFLPFFGLEDPSQSEALDQADGEHPIDGLGERKDNHLFDSFSFSHFWLRVGLSPNCLPASRFRDK